MLQKVVNSIVQNEELKDLMSELDWRYKVPRRTVMNRELNKLLIDLSDMKWVPA